MNIQKQKIVFLKEMNNFFHRASHEVLNYRMNGNIPAAERIAVLTAFLDTIKENVIKELKKELDV